VAGESEAAGAGSAEEQAPREKMLGAMAVVMERQARVARAEAALDAARRRLRDALACLSRLRDTHGEMEEVPALVTAALSSDAGLAADADLQGLRSGTLRERIVLVMEADPEEVYTPARLSPLVGSSNRDSIRNTLLVLAGKGRIEKLGPGQYRAARAPEAPPAAPPMASGDG
jgi:hypothetical protein